MNNIFMNIVIFMSIWIEFMCNKICAGNLCLLVKSQILKS